MFCGHKTECVLGILNFSLLVFYFHLVLPEACLSSAGLRETNLLSTSEHFPLATGIATYFPT